MNYIDMTLPEMTEAVARMGEKAFRAKQIYEWINLKNAVSWDEMTNLSKALRQRLEREEPLHSPRKREVLISKIDGTRKYLFEMYDGSLVESVLMKYRHGNTVCISSQVGCRMGCAFCASTIGGLTRNLTAGEMLGQVYAVESDLGERISNVVVMGTGEPLDNYDNLVRFIRMLTDEDGHHISERNVTVSTCGIVPGIKKLKEEKLMINLALSLHAPNDELRRTIMPIAKSYPLREVLGAMDEYYQSTGRRLTFEYSLIEGVNDSDKCAAQLAEKIKKFNCLVNLIPVNPVRERKFTPPDRLAAFAFQKKLEKNGINVTIRREMGRDIDGACGQLRKRYLETDNL
ncbi:MAG: 23S rRNA (adenine(2503)-C(2))-methyltransferase RlmN [Lachnospiraceae bacterium]|nr:23S rRNA (adenine(2503)-C(2))-methyltransferase RlmN [Lachnospiraceae bacterium]